MAERFLGKEKTGLWLMDVQEKLFPLVDRSYEILERICFVIEGALALKLPIFVTEQNPSKLGQTVATIKKHLPVGQLIYPKTTFSGYQDGDIQKAIDKIDVTSWILIGIEAHICVLQTAKDLLDAKKM